MPKTWLVKLPGVAMLTHPAGSVSDCACHKAPCGNTFRLQLHLAFPVDKNHGHSCGTKLGGFGLSLF